MASTSLPTKWTSYTPTFQGYGTVTGIEFFYKMSPDGKYVDIRGKYTSGTATAVEGRIGLPVTSGDSTIIPSLSNAGYQYLNAAVGNAVFSILIEPSVAYMTVGIHDASRAGLAKRNGSDISLNGNIWSLVARVPLN